MKKCKLSIDISNSTSLTLEEEHKGVYLKPSDIVQINCVKAKWNPKEKYK